MEKLKSFAIFVGKSFVFSCILTVVWAYSYRIGGSATSTQAATTASQIETYEKQVATVSRQLEVVEAQQKKMDKNLLAQEEIAKRFDAVMKVWERNAGLRK